MCICYANNNKLRKLYRLVPIYLQIRGKTMLKLNSTQDFRLLLPETVPLEAEHFAFAFSTSCLNNNVDNAWQTYLNTLALLAFEAWLADEITDIGIAKSHNKQVIYQDMQQIAIAGSLQLGDYSFCVIATEHLLDEFVNIPQEIIGQLHLTPHFYVLLEVLEEEKEAIIRGFLPYNQLIQIQNNLQLPVHDGAYQIPLSYFDIEPNHMLTYYLHAQPSEFIIPILDKQVRQVNQVNQSSNNLTKVITSTTKLSQWLQGVINEAWQTIDSLANPELALALSTRNTNQYTKRAKIINLGLDFTSRQFVLLVSISPDVSDNTQEKISVLAQLYPLGEERFLPQNIKLMLLSKTDKILQEVTATTQDNYIQLKTFKGEPGIKFSIQVTLENVSLYENFEL
jgi:Protein of unknown function (DUF1822)